MVINPIVGVYKPIIRIPIKGGMTIPNTMSLDTGTHDQRASCTAQKMIWKGASFHQRLEVSTFIFDLPSLKLT